MLIWLNGAFGAGKTQTAHELQRRVANAHVADPELIGFAIHKMLPAAERRDFQDRPQWRSSVVATLSQADTAHHGIVIVPMTIVRDDYFDEMIGGLRAGGVDVRHYALIASSDTLRKRLRHRLGPVGLARSDTWAVQQIPRCVAALATSRYATHLATDGRTVDEVVEHIAQHAGLTLNRPRLSPAAYQARRFAVGIRHIRW
jgi:gluconate kinase